MLNPPPRVHDARARETLTLTLGSFVGSLESYTTPEESPPRILAVFHPL